MENFSPTYISGLIVVIMGVCSLFKINLFNQEELTRIIEALAIIIGGGTTIYRRFKKGGVNAFGMIKR